MKTAHIIYVHDRDNSYNHALKNTAVETLEQQGWHVVVSDLYTDSAMLNRYFGESLTAEQEQYIANEQEKIRTSQLTLVQFPMYWFSTPAIFKNYFDLVYAYGFAYPGSFEDSPLNDGRCALLSVTTNSREDTYSQQGKAEPMPDLLLPMELSYRFCGHQILPHIAHYGVPQWEEAQLTQHLNDYAQQLIERLAAVA